MFRNLNARLVDPRATKVLTGKKTCELPPRIDLLISHNSKADGSLVNKYGVRDVNCSSSFLAPGNQYLVRRDGPRWSLERTNDFSIELDTAMKRDNSYHGHAQGTL